jgi:hypothetical protein
VVAVLVMRLWRRHALRHVYITDPNKDPYRRPGYMGQLDLKSQINPTQAFNAMKAGQMPKCSAAARSPLTTATTAKSAYDLGSTLNKMYDKVPGSFGANAPDASRRPRLQPIPAAPAQAHPSPWQRPEGLGAVSGRPAAHHGRRLEAKRHWHPTQARLASQQPRRLKAALRHQLPPPPLAACIR